MPPSDRAATRIIAHRGASSQAPENTLAAFRAAVALGADGVEFDVQGTRDGVPVVIHDPTLERTTNGHGAVAGASAAELGALEAGGWFVPPHPGERVPALEAVLALLAPTALELHIELKTARIAYPGLVPAVVQQVRAAGMGGRVVLSSYNHHSLLEARRLAPEIACAALTYEVLIEPWRYATQHGLQGLHPQHTTVDAELVRAAHAAGLAVRAYTVDDPEEAGRLMALGVDGIITNQPARLLQLRGGMGGT
ncbi:MAG TPA: glycerophosphodiester phosphodiesterase [bacterium]|nr:glycerophosphodiester phosphodiesterase [bacterium]